MGEQRSRKVEPMNMNDALLIIVATAFGAGFATILVIVQLFMGKILSDRREQYQRRERRYIKLLDSLTGFYQSTNDDKLRSKFLTELDRCWLYCNDDVINRCYEFLNSVSEDSESSGEEKELALGNLVLALRKDMLPRRIFRLKNPKRWPMSWISNTRLKPSDYRPLKSS